MITLTFVQVCISHVASLTKNGSVERPPTHLSAPSFTFRLHTLTHRVKLVKSLTLQYKHAHLGTMCLRQWSVAMLCFFQSR